MAFLILVRSLAAAILVQRFIPQYSLGLVLNTLLITCIQYLGLQVFRAVVYPRYFSPLRDIPSAPDWKLFTGHTRELFKEPSGYPQCKWVDTVPNDGLIRYSMFGRERLLLTNPKTLGEVLVTRNYDFIKPKQIRQGLGRTLGIGILLAEGEEHKVQRKNLMPAFAFRHIKDLHSTFWAKARELTDCLAEASTVTEAAPESKGAEKTDQSGKTGDHAPKHAPGTIEVGNWSSRATLDIIGLSGMGQDFDSLHNEGNKLNQTYRQLFDIDAVGTILRVLGFLLPFGVMSRLPIKRNTQVDDAADYIKEVCRDLIAKKRIQISEKGRSEVDILSVALESGGFTDEELVNQMMTFLVAGHETTATAMIWAMYSLCKHPDIQEKLRAEVRSNLPPLDQDITAADIDNCHYLKAVCNEVLRIWSPVSLTLRVSACDTSINGHFIPQGTTIIIPPWAINRSKHLWGEDAAEFKPERWLDPDGKADNKGGADSNFSFLTFLHGPRSCIGQKFAQAEFECLLAAWVMRFQTDFEEGSLIAKGEMKLGGGVTVKPKGGLWVNLKEIDG